MYINGILNNSIPYTQSIKSSLAGIVLGGNAEQDGTGSSQFFKGIISNVFLTKDVLSEAVINANFVNGFNYTETENTYFNYDFN